MRISVHPRGPPHSAEGKVALFMRTCHLIIRGQRKAGFNSCNEALRCMGFKSCSKGQPEATTHFLFACPNPYYSSLVLDVYWALSYA